MDVATVLRDWVTRRLESVPAWVTVLVTAAVVGAVSAVVAVTGLALRRHQEPPELEVPSDTSE
jgi:hypothetical protein